MSSYLGSFVDVTSLFLANSTSRLVDDRRTRGFLQLHEDVLSLSLWTSFHSLIKSPTVLDPVATPQQRDREKATHVKKVDNYVTDIGTFLSEDAGVI